MPLQHFPHFSDFPTQGQKTKIQPKNTKDRRKRLPMSTICHTRKCSHAHAEQPTTRQKSTTKHTPTEKHLPSTSRTRHLPHFSDFSTQGQKTKIQPKNTKDRRKSLPMSTICHTRKCSHANAEQPTTRQKSTTKHTPTEKHLPSTSRTRSPSPPLKRIFYPGSKDKIQPKNTKDRRKRLPMSTICHTRKCSHAHPELSYQQHATKARQNTHRQKNTFPPPRALARHLPHSSEFSTQGQKTRFNQKTQKTVASACRCLPFVTRESVPTRTLNYEYQQQAKFRFFFKQAKKARQNTHRQKTLSLRSEPHERHSTEKDKLSPLSRNAICLSWSNKAKDDSRTTPEDVIARKTREMGGARPSCSGPGRPRTRVRSAKQFPRTARNSKQGEG